MKPEDLEKIAKIHEQYKSVSKVCKDLYFLLEKLSENNENGLHVCVNQSSHTDIPPIKISNLSNIAETIMGVVKEAREGNRSAHVDLTNPESLEVIRLILKLKTAEKKQLEVDLKNLGVDIV